MYSIVLMAALSTSGDVPAFGRHGCNGCWGGCYGCNGCWGGRAGWRRGCHGCWGGCYGCWGSCYGCSGGYSGWGRGYGYAYAPAAYAPRVFATKTVPTIEDSAARAARRSSATLLVSLPADAKLFVDDQPTTSTTARRVFQSPSLEPGNTYSYSLRAEMQREGRKYQQVKNVDVRAGQKAAVRFSEEGILQTVRAER
jgi:uncharacterized protein (TIGR03000 family)